MLEANKALEKQLIKRDNVIRQLDASLAEREGQCKSSLITIKLDDSLGVQRERSLENDIKLMSDELMACMAGWESDRTVSALIHHFCPDNLSRN